MIAMRPHFALISTVTFSVAWVATALLRSASADLRSRIWRAALVSMVLASVPLPAPEAVRISMSSGFGVDAGGTLPGYAPPWLLWAWAAGSLLILARLGGGLVQLTRLTRAARRLDGDLLESAIALTPLTWGVLHPVIVLPAYTAEWSADERGRAIRHERAHIERCDWLWQLFAHLATAAFWFHPLVWLAAAELRRESELAADNAVLDAGCDAPAYASQLVEVARRLCRRKDIPAAAVAVAMARARRNTIELRVAAILNCAGSRAAAGPRARWAVILTAALLLVPMSVLEAAKTHRIGESGLTPPKVAAKVDPQYTEEARTAKIQGTTVLTLVVNEKGQAEKIKIKRTLDKGLDAKAIEAVKQWHFEPATLKDKPVRVAATIEVNFKLR